MPIRARAFCNENLGDYFCGYPPPFAWPFMQKLRAYEGNSGCLLKQVSNRQVSTGRANQGTQVVGRRAPGTPQRSRLKNCLKERLRKLGARQLSLPSRDTVALQLCLERIAPVRKGRPISLALPSMSTSADVSTAISAIVTQMAKGEITPEEAAIAASVLETKRKALETEDSDRRLRAIEQQLANGKWR